MNISLLIEIILYVVSIILGYLAFRNSKTTDKKTDLAIGLMVTILGFFITSFIMMRFVHLERIMNNQEFIENLKADNESKRIAEDITNSKQTFKDENNIYFESIFNKRKNDFKEFLEHLNNGNLEYKQQDFGLFEKDVVEIFNNVQNNQIILATSRVDYNSWWEKKDFGAKYWDANVRAINEKQCLIKRIWIFDNEEEKNKQLNELSKQTKAGVETFYVYNSDIKDIIEKKRDVIVVGDTYSGELILNERDMSKVIFYSNNKDIKQIKDDWNELFKKAKPFKE